ncbi:MAG: hypothetical protein CMJ58_23250 [Planctomycetaceae bacterium]|nr:hypothetical protein [Planctomycetaceae bacterium]
MSEKTTFDPFDPTGMIKTMRDKGMEAWAKAMTEAVNTDAYSEATGQMLDTWLKTSGPFREMMQKLVAQSMAEANLPSREDITRLAERFTNLEMRLDDLDAKFDECLTLLRAGGSSKKKQKSS